MKKIRRLPTILGLTVLLLGIGAGVILIRQGPNFFLRAEAEAKPKQIKITNLSDTSFSVSWVTDLPVSGFVKYDTDSKLTSTAKDDRDQLSGQTESFSTHHVTLKNLNPATKYYFKIGSGGGLFDNNGQLYETTTAPIIQTASPPNDVAYGTVVDQSDNPAEGAVIYLSLANTTPLSTLTKSSGNWVIPINLARSTELDSYATYDPEASIEEIFVQGASQGNSTATTITQNDTPVPTIKLGENADFTTTSTPDLETPEETTPTPTPAPSQFTLGELNPPITASPSGEVTIVNPETAENVNTQKPEIMGTGPVGKVLRITVESPETYTDEIIIDEEGNWTWSPPADLEPGEHTVTISYLDEEGEEKTVSRSFTVLAAGDSELPSLSGSPSGEATLSPTPSLSPTATPSTRTAMPSTEGGVPDSGFMTPTFILFLGGLGMILVSFVLKIVIQ
jgi:hypothetical protein